MVWAKLGSTILGTAGDTIDVSGFTANKFNSYLTHAIKSGSGIGTTLTLDGVGGTSYALRYIENGALGTRLSEPSWVLRFNANDQFDVGYILNITNEEKLMIGWHVAENATGANNFANRSTFAGKFVQNAQFTQITNTNDQGGDFAISSNLSALGSDGVEELRVQDGAVYYDKTLNKEYVLNSNVWTEL